MTDKSKEGSFVSHLTELRSRLINSLIFIFVIFIIGYFFAENIYNFLMITNQILFLLLEIGEKCLLLVQLQLI